MIIKIFDVTGEKFNLEIPENISLKEFKEIYRNKRNYNVTSLFFFFKSFPLKENFIFKPELFNNSNVIVVYDTNIFPSRDFPNSCEHLKFDFPKYFNVYESFTPSNNNFFNNRRNSREFY